MITDHVATMEECRKPVTVHAILIIKLLKVTNVRSVIVFQENEYDISKLVMQSTNIDV
jgi:hypothetical protein